MGAGGSKSPPARGSSHNSSPYKLRDHDDFSASPGSSRGDSSFAYDSNSSTGSPGSPQSPSRTPRRKRSAIEEIRIKAEQTANRAAEKRFAQKQQEVHYPGMPSSPLKKRDKMLLSISVTTPQNLRVTSSAISVKWAPEQSGGAARIKRYDIQWCIDTKDIHDLRTMDGWIDVVRYIDSGSGVGQPVRDRLHFSTDRNWHSVPEEAVNGLKLEASVCGLKPSCYPVKFRVRGRCNAGWGPWSGQSGGFRTLRGDIPAPAFSSVTSNSLEMRWRGMKDKRYGKLKSYVLLGKSDSDDDTWRECYRGIQPKVLVTRIGETGLVAKTVYFFKVMIIASHGPDPSRDDSQLMSDMVKIETLGTKPNAPRAPRIVSVSHESITVSWTPPCSNGSSITAFQLVGKMGHSKVYSEWYTGPNTKFTVGVARSTVMNFSTTRILALTEYNLKIAASNAYGMSSYSTPVMAVTDPPPDLQLPDAPPMSSDLAASSEVSNESQIAATTNAAATHYFSVGNFSSDLAPYSPGSISESGSSGESKSSPGAGDFSYGPRRVSSPTQNNKNVRSIEGGWLECWDTKEHAFYYFHPHSGCTQWEHPSKVQKADASLVFRRKRFRFLYLLQKEKRGEDAPGTTGESQPVLPLTIDRAHVVFTSFSQLRSEASDPSVLVRVPKVRFVGEVGIDSGGVSKDWFLNLSRTISDPQLCLFRFCKGEDGKLCVIDPRSSINHEHLEYFRFVGRILGMAIFHRHLIDLKFPRWLYKQLLGTPVVLADLAETEPVLCQSLKWLLDNKVGDDSDFDFTVTKEGFGTTEIVELIPDGKNISVTDENKDLYVSLQVQWRVNGSILDQINAMRRGFAELIPNSHVCVFTPEELLLLLNGKSKIELGEMLASTRYTGGYEEHSMPVKLFWEVFTKMSQEERQNMLKFATGATRVPLDGFDPQFTITRGSSGTESLPSAHTCFNQLVLPPYMDASVLAKKLRTAVTETASFELT